MWQAPGKICYLFQSCTNFKSNFAILARCKTSKSQKAKMRSICGAHTVLLLDSAVVFLKESTDSDGSKGDGPHNLSFSYTFY